MGSNTEKSICANRGGKSFSVDSKNEVGCVGIGIFCIYVAPAKVSETPGGHYKSPANICSVQPSRFCVLNYWVLRNGSVPFVFIRIFEIRLFIFLFPFSANMPSQSNSLSPICYYSHHNIVNSCRTSSFTEFPSLG